MQDRILQKIPSKLIYQRTLNRKNKKLSKNTGIQLWIKI